MIEHRPGMQGRIDGPDYDDPLDGLAAHLMRKFTRRVQLARMEVRPKADLVTAANDMLKVQRHLRLGETRQAMRRYKLAMATIGALRSQINGPERLLTHAQRRQRLAEIEAELR